MDQDILFETYNNDVNVHVILGRIIQNETKSFIFGIFNYSPKLVNLLVIITKSKEINSKNYSSIFKDKFKLFEL